MRGFLRGDAEAGQFSTLLPAEQQLGVVDA
jgi:hypothetical protein